MGVPAEPRDFRLLLVENNSDHAELTLRAIEQATGVTGVFWVKDGAEALDFLHNRGCYSDPAVAPAPAVILLDLKLPKIDGHEVLRRIKADPRLQTIPVVMLTTSKQQAEAEESYRLGAAGFVTKPVMYSELVARLRSLECLQSR